MRTRVSAKRHTRQRANIMVMPVSSCVEPPRVTNNMWPIPCSEPANDDVISFSYRLLATSGCWGKFDDRCDISKKSLTASRIMQTGEPVTIGQTPRFFDPPKPISAAFWGGLCGLDQGCQPLSQIFSLILVDAERFPFGDEALGVFFEPIHAWVTGADIRLLFGLKKI